MSRVVRYARNQDVALAYQVVGQGPVDLLFVPWFGSNLIWNWELPSYAHFLERLSSFARLIIVDRRGTGLSDRPSPEAFPPLEVLADDLGVVLDAVDSPSASLFGTQDGASTCALFAATHPTRVERLILYTMDPGGEQSWEGSWGIREREEYIERVATDWGSESFARWYMEPRAPSLIGDPSAVAWYTSWMQLAASPSGAAALFYNYLYTNAQPALESIGVPTLILHRVGDRIDPIEEGRYVAQLVPGAAARGVAW